MTDDSTTAAGRVFARGYCGFGNEGDEAILEGLRAGLEAQRPGLGGHLRSNLRGHLSHARPDR